MTAICRTKPVQIITAAVCIALLTGCSLDNRSRSSGVPSQGTTIEVRGDWDDVESAVQVAAGHSEMAIEAGAGFALQPAEVAEVPTRRCRYELVTAADEPVLIRFAALSTDDPGPIRITVLVGAFGDQPREAALLGELRRRLEDLAGKDWAPVRN